MSVQNVKRFYELVEKDKALKEEMSKIDAGLNKEQISLKDLSSIIGGKIIPMARKHNCNFTEKDLLGYFEEQVKTLDLEDLMQISGGISQRAAGIGLGAIMLLGLGGTATMNLMKGQSNNEGMTSVSQPAEKDKPKSKENRIEAYPGSKSGVGNTAKKVDTIKRAVPSAGRLKNGKTMNIGMKDAAENAAKTGKIERIRQKSPDEVTAESVNRQGATRLAEQKVTDAEKKPETRLEKVKNVKGLPVYEDSKAGHPIDDDDDLGGLLKKFFKEINDGKASSEQDASEKKAGEQGPNGQQDASEKKAGEQGPNGQQDASEKKAGEQGPNGQQDASEKKAGEQGPNGQQDASGETVEGDTDAEKELEIIINGGLKDEVDKVLAEIDGNGQDASEKKAGEQGPNGQQDASGETVEGDTDAEKELEIIINGGLEDEVNKVLAGINGNGQDASEKTDLKEKFGKILKAAKNGMQQATKLVGLVALAGLAVQTALQQLGTPTTNGNVSATLPEVSAEMTSVFKKGINNKDLSGFGSKVMRECTDEDVRIYLNLCSRVPTILQNGYNILPELIDHCTKIVCVPKQDQLNNGQQPVGELTLPWSLGTPNSTEDGTSMWGLNDPSALIKAIQNYDVTNSNIHHINQEPVAQPGGELTRLWSFGNGLAGNPDDQGAPQNQGKVRENGQQPGNTPVVNADGPALAGGNKKEPVAQIDGAAEETKRDATDSAKDQGNVGENGQQTGNTMVARDTVVNANDTDLAEDNKKEPVAQTEVTSKETSKGIEQSVDSLGNQGVTDVNNSVGKPVATETKGDATDSAKDQGNVGENGQQAGNTMVARDTVVNANDTDLAEDNKKEPVAQTEVTSKETSKGIEQSVDSLGNQGVTDVNNSVGKPVATETKGDATDSAKDQGNVGENGQQAGNTMVARDTVVNANDTDLAEDNKKEPVAQTEVTSKETSKGIEQSVDSLGNQGVTDSSLATVYDFNEQESEDNVDVGQIDDAAEETEGDDTGFAKNQGNVGENGQQAGNTPVVNADDTALAGGNKKEPVAKTEGIINEDVAKFANAWSLLGKVTGAALKVVGLLGGAKNVPKEGDGNNHQGEDASENGTDGKDEGAQKDSSDGEKKNRR